MTNSIASAKCPSVLTSGKYGMSQQRTSNTNDDTKEYIFLKLTDSAYRAIEEYQRNVQLKRLAPSQRAKIQFVDNSGVIHFPSPDSIRSGDCGISSNSSRSPDSSDRKFGFSIDEVEGSLECVRQTGPQLDVLGTLNYRMRIHANEDVYDSTRTKMAIAEETEKSKCIREIKPNQNDIGRKIKRSAIIAPLHSYSNGKNNSNNNTINNSNINNTKRFNTNNVNNSINYLNGNNSNKKGSGNSNNSGNNLPMLNKSPQSAMFGNSNSQQSTTISRSNYRQSPSSSMISGNNASINNNNNESNNNTYNNSSSNYTSSSSSSMMTSAASLSSTLAGGLTTGYQSVSYGSTSLNSISSSNNQKNIRSKNTNNLNSSINNINNNHNNGNNNNNNMSSNTGRSNGCLLGSKSATIKNGNTTSISNNGCNGGRIHDVSRRKIRERLIHLLALKPFKKPELYTRLQNEGLAQRERQLISNILKDISTMSRDNTYNLRRSIWNDVNENWPYFTEQELQQLRRRKPQNLTPPMSSDASSSTSGQSPTLSSHTGSPPPLVNNTLGSTNIMGIGGINKSNSLKRTTLESDIYDGALQTSIPTKKQRISHYKKDSSLGIVTKLNNTSYGSINYNQSNRNQSILSPHNNQNFNIGGSNNNSLPIDDHYEHTDLSYNILSNVDDFMSHATFGTGIDQLPNVKNINNSNNISMISKQISLSNENNRKNSDDTINCNEKDNTGNNHNNNNNNSSNNRKSLTLRRKQSPISSNQNFISESKIQGDDDDDNLTANVNSANRVSYLQQQSSNSYYYQHHQQNQQQQQQKQQQQTQQQQKVTTIEGCDSNSCNESQYHSISRESISQKYTNCDRNNVNNYQQMQQNRSVTSPNYENIQQLISTSPQAFQSPEYHLSPTVSSVTVRSPLNQLQTQQQEENQHQKIYHEENYHHHEYEEHSPTQQQIAAVANTFSTTASSSSTDAPRYDFSNYTSIISIDQRRQYKTEFESDYDEYRKLLTQLGNVAQRFREMADRLKRVRQGCPDYYKIKDEIVNEYNRVRNEDAINHDKQRFDYLHEKLAHIKQLVMDYDKKLTSGIIQSAQQSITVQSERWQNQENQQQIQTSNIINIYDDTNNINKQLKHQMKYHQPETIHVEQAQKQGPEHVSLNNIHNESNQKQNKNNVLHHWSDNNNSHNEMYIDKSDMPYNLNTTNLNDSQEYERQKSTKQQLHNEKQQIESKDQYNDDSSDSDSYSDSEGSTTTTDDDSDIDNDDMSDDDNENNSHRNSDNGNHIINNNNKNKNNKNNNNKNHKNKHENKSSILY